MDKRTLIIPGAAVVALAAGYFGLSAYAASQAEKQLEDWLYDNKLDDMLRWDSVSASPFGSAYTLHDVSIVGKDQFKGLDLDVDSIRVADQADERDLKSISLELHGIRPAGNERGPAAALYELLQASGRQELEPFDLTLSTRYDAEERQANLSFSLDVPQLFAGEGSLQFNNARNLDRELETLGASAAQLAMLGSLGVFGLGEVMDKLEAVEIGNASFTLRDNGYFKRSNSLRERYSYELDSSKGSAGEQREKIAEREQRQWQQDCQKTWERAYKGAEDACEAWWQALHGQKDGVRISLEPENRVRLSDLDGITRDPDRAGRTLARLNLSIDSL
ncbi:hypothetical protein SBP02_19595 [Pseudomonas benzenivorans]|uniref:DUF945 domain-containing protein n=1 Tax=Pseudomonas benzenivorans TaxID=556533 RepID=A0ABZ0PW11_9PSED|nr:hypothetical protein [Pseudomonas benzenivorans]WPC04931.1 hypothetical protein SBP02_19595 [Pseudomonas benzenivorans]